MTSITNIKVLNADAKFFGFEKYDNGTIQIVDGNEIKVVIKRGFSLSTRLSRTNEPKLKHLYRRYEVYLNGEKVLSHRSLNHKNNTVTSIIRKIKGENK